MMLTTPAMASVPYWAAAPSCSTSMWSMAEVGMKFMSADAAPPKVPNSTAMLPVPCRRSPSTSTRVWLGLTPRSLNALLNAAWSVPEFCACKDGMLAANPCTRSGLPTRLMMSSPSTCTGAGLSTALRPVARVPVTTTASTAPLLSVWAAAVWANPWPAVSAVSAKALAPANKYFISKSP